MRFIRGKRRVWFVAVVLLSAACSTGPRHVAHEARARPTTTTSPSTTTTVAAGKVVSYHDIHVNVPDSWAVVDGNHTGQCGDPFPSTPTAFLGPQLNPAPSCPATTAGPPRDGVWLRPGSGPAGASQATLPSGLVVLEQKTGSDESLWAYGVEVEVEFGPDPSVGEGIANSIGFTYGAPDTPATGVCVVSPRPGALPPQQRLAQQMVLNGGNYVLSPPAASDRPTISASQAWSKVQASAVASGSLDTDRILLTRLSAHGASAGGGSHPQNRLVWAIYSMPNSPTIPGCGNWGLTAVDSSSGQPLFSVTWTPGP